jgi:hypothetical protein
MGIWAKVDDPQVIFTGPSPRGWHRLQTAAECLQKYAWSYETEEPKEDISGRPALAIGSLVHLALAQYYSRMKQEQEGKNPNEYMAPAEAVKLVASLTKQDKHIDNVLQTFEAYEKRYWQDINTRTIVAVETLFDGFIAPSDDPEEKYRLTGRIDLLFRDMRGQLWAEDHKTTARLTKKHTEYYGISGQMLGYEHLVRQQYEDLVGFKLNLIQHAAYQKPVFQRVAIPRRPELERQFADRAVDIERLIAQMRAEGRGVGEWPKAMSELVCFHRYGACEHIDKCKLGKGAKKGGAWSWE